MVGCHINWHAAVYHVEKGNYDAALEIFDNAVSFTVYLSFCWCRMGTWRGGDVGSALVNQVFDWIELSSCLAYLSLERLYIFGAICIFFVKLCTIPFTELSLLGLVRDVLVLRCSDTVGWVIWPVKSSPKMTCSWPISDNDEVLHTSEEFSILPSILYLA